MEFLQQFARMRPQLRELLERAMTEPPIYPNQLLSFAAADYGVSSDEMQYVREHVARQRGYEVHHAVDDSLFYVRFIGDQAHWVEGERPDEAMRQQARELLSQYGRSH